MTTSEIKRLLPATREGDLRHIINGHPNSEDLYCTTLIETREHFGLNYWFETHEFAALVELKTNLQYTTALEIFLDESQRIVETLSLFPNGTTKFLYTHESHTNRKLSELADRYSQAYLRFLDEHNVSLPKNLRKMIESDPGNCNSLRIFCTYSPEMNGGAAVVVEPMRWHLSSAYHKGMMEAASQIFGIKFE